MRVQVLQYLLAHPSYRLKCDRQTPCASCASTGIGSSCHYATRPANGLERRDEGLRTSEAHLRLQKLEEMVTSLMQKTGDGLDGSKSNIAPSNGTIERSISTLSVDGSSHYPNGSSNGHLDYQGATHWSAILENVRSSLSNFFSVSLTRSRFGIYKAYSSQK
jgi:Fungal Zn(2)-Cys(6) binuclear cluster domain